MQKILLAVILMKSISYEPKLLEIMEGESVTWENVSLTDHSATANDQGFDTGMIAPKSKSKPIVFAKPGTFTYHCNLHGRTMSGTVVVKGR